MLIHKSYKTELKPNNKQKTLFMKGCGVARFVYNWGLSKKKEQYEKKLKLSNAYQLDKELNSIKKQQFPWMYEVSKWCCQIPLQNLDKAFNNFFRRCKNKSIQEKGFPKFKSKKNGIGGFKLCGHICIKSNKILLPRIGWVRLKETGYLPTDGTKGVKLLFATVSEKQEDGLFLLI